MESYAQLIAECREDLRAGRLNRVKARLAALKLAEVPAEHRVDLARLARQAHEVNVGLRLLTPLVQPEGVSSEASAEVRAEYAALLSDSGATTEALALLQELDATKTPFVHQIRAQCLSSEANTSGVRDALRQHLQASLDDDTRLESRVGLVKASVTLADSSAIEDIESLIVEARNHDRLDLLCHLYEARIELGLRDKKFVEVQRDLQEATVLLSLDPLLDSFFVRKWQIIAEALSSHDIGRLAEIEAAARERSDWETVRKLDFYRLRIRFDQGLYDRLYAGTPAKDLREQFERELNVRASDTHLLGQAGGVVLRLSTGEAITPSGILPIPAQALKILKSLTKDLYRPLKVAALHAELFPGDKFNIQSSPNRVHQSVTRARQWFAAQNLAIQITNEHSMFSLRLNGPVAIELALDAVMDWPDVRLGRLNQVFGSAYFSRKQACEKLNMTPSTFNRIANAGLEHGLLERFGHGSSVTYRLTV